MRNSRQDDPGKRLAQLTGAPMRRAGDQVVQQATQEPPKEEPRRSTPLPVPETAPAPPTSGQEMRPSEARRRGKR